jgi:flagellin
MENRLEKEYNNNTNYNENLQSAESTIRDTDMSEEITANAKHEILLQAAQAMMAQANSSSEYVLNLLNA